MRTIELAGKKVEIYDDIESLPITRFHKYNKMLLVDSGIGSDMSDFDRHIEKAMSFAKSKTPQMAVTELENLRQNVYFVQNNISPRYLSFAALVKSIDGTPCDDISDDGLQKIVDILSDATNEELADQIGAVKKKIDDELRIYFPSLFDDAAIKEYYDKLKARTVAILDTVVKGEATEKDMSEIGKITDALITYFSPGVYSGSESLEIKHDRNFEEMCILLSQHLHVDPKKFSVLEYYSAFEYIKKQAKNANKARKNK